VPSNFWGPEVAQAYDATTPDMFEVELLDQTVGLLAELAAGGPALELAIGTGRVGLPLSARGVEVHGIELSPHMAEQLTAKPGADAIALTIGDMTSARVDGEFSLVYLVFNTLMNVTTQDEQLAVFENAFRHLRPGGRFVLELVVPQLHRAMGDEQGWVFSLEPDHVAVETFDDVVAQIAWSHHWMAVDGRLVHHAAPYRYVWPAELVLMGRLTGFELEARWADWTRAPFTADSPSHVAVFRRPWTTQA
jgi:SAM-dependent methyltransferase